MSPESLHDGTELPAPPPRELDLTSELTRVRRERDSSYAARDEAERARDRAEADRRSAERAGDDARKSLELLREEVLFLREQIASNRRHLAEIIAPALADAHRECAALLEELAKLRAPEAEDMEVPEAGPSARLSPTSSIRIVSRDGRHRPPERS